MGKWIIFALVVGGGLWLMYGLPDGTLTPYLNKVSEIKTQFFKELNYIKNLF